MLRLPIAEAESLHPNHPGFSNLRVVLIDANRTARYVLAQQLENWGVHVTQTTDLGTPPAEPYDIAFVRSAPDQAITPRYARQIVAIGNETAPPAATERVTLPVNQPNLFSLLMRISQRAEQDSRSPVAHRILVADDYPVNIELVIRALEHLDIQVDAVENGQQALEQLEQDHYDLILMDIQMPVMDGMEATQRIRASSVPYRDVPILALTASVMREEQDEYLSMGVNDIICKPFSVKNLRQVVLKWLTPDSGAT
jgi:CheY-like chemotaxis protein